MNLIKPLTLEIDEEVWTKFKEIVPRTKTLNSVVANLITDFVTDNKEDYEPPEKEHIVDEDKEAHADLKKDDTDTKLEV